MERSVCIILAGIVLIAGLSGCVERVAYVRPEPPAPQVEVVSVAPYVGAVWVGGDWAWHPRHHRYYWRPGHWQGRH